MSLYIKTGQPVQETASQTQAFRLTTAGAGSVLPQDNRESPKYQTGNWLMCGQSYKKRNGRERAASLSI